MRIALPALTILILAGSAWLRGVERSAERGSQAGGESSAQVPAKTEAWAPRAEAAPEPKEPRGQDGYEEPLVPGFDLAQLAPPVVSEHEDPEAEHGGATETPAAQGSLLASLGGLDFDFSAGERAAFHPHGSRQCASGCAASNHPTEELTPARFQRLVSRFATEPIDETSEAFETLLYFGRQTKVFLDLYGDSPLDGARAAALRRELSRTHARIEIRVVDEQGNPRSWLPPTRVPLDRRHVFQMSTEDVQPLVTSGTVKRVGLYHVWTRL